MASYIARRKFLATLLGGAAAVWPLAARAQQRADRVRRIAWFGLGRSDEPSPYVDALRSKKRPMKSLRSVDAFGNRLFRCCPMGRT